jgi:hypothetical protein
VAEYPRSRGGDLDDGLARLDLRDPLARLDVGAVVNQPGNERDALRRLP